MNDTNPLSPDELESLLAELSEDTISHERHEQLQATLLNDPAARQTYVKYFDTHALLFWKMGGVHREESSQALQNDTSLLGDMPRPEQSGNTGIDRDILNDLVAQALADRRRREIEESANVKLLADMKDVARERRQEFDPEPTQVRTIVIPRPLIWLGVAAVIGFAALLFYPTASKTPDPTMTAQTPSAVQPTPTPDPDPALARIVHHFEARWEDDITPADSGQQLHRGEYTLQHGLVELELTDGARVVLEAPISFELKGPNAMALNRGRMVARIPESAHGFSVDTPTAQVIDHGTEFGVSVDESNQTQSHVFVGRIEVQTQGRSVMLATGQAASVPQAGQIQPTEAPLVALFARQVPATAYQAAVLRSRPICCWRGPIEEATGQLQDYGWLGAHAQAQGPVRSAFHGFAANDPTGSLDFLSGQTTRLTVKPEHRPTLARVFSGAFSIETWCWIQPGHTDYMRILSATQDNDNGLSLGVTGQRQLLPGVTGNRPILTLLGKVDIVGEQVLQEGRWHHLVAVIDQRGQVTFYVDGLPSENQRLPGSGQQPGTTTGPPLVIGQNPYRAEDPQPWQGRLDEIAVYDRALTPEEVREHLHNAEILPSGL